MANDYSIDLQPLVKLKNNIILRGSTGSLKNPFLGILTTSIRICNHRVLSHPIKMSYHVLKETVALKSPILGISFLKENHCTLDFHNDIFKFKIDKRIISVKTNSKQFKYSFYMTHSQIVCSEVIQCACSSLISTPTVCRVLPKYQPLLNTTIVRLNPGTVCKISKKSRLYSQTFVFEVSLDTSLQLGDLALELERVDEPKSVNSQICIVNHFDELSGEESNSFPDMLVR